MGGQLPVLGVQPKTIQDVAAQLGRLLNVTGVWDDKWSVVVFKIITFFFINFVFRLRTSVCRANTPNKR